MRTAPIAAASILLAALALTACSSDSGGDGGSGSGNDTPASEKKDTGTACKASALTIAFGPSSAAPAAGDEGAVPVTLTNEKGTACTLKGFAAVHLSGGGDSWGLKSQEGAQAAELTLAKGQSASFTISYVRGVAGDSAKSAELEEVVFKLPDDSETKTYKWPDAEVELKSVDRISATVGPFLPVGD
ncbi:hypothetical protein SGFS_068350 [Streptomyces graminofaciens]|uniref:DUF4232 domain-containing protein n=1 Tax=Streptomyces graminofaciens TaxID=68212 RepID=A0ABM7FG37_9ACTN|nr:DUF4232 domain-containing protein [Streptomyces graminofaciens]BBC35541.1 hypothetical protein SGFS_068350 [Streptomyces graminofaciens]